MILTCPACGTRYAVKDGAIPEGGRQVRCASCKHSWHQDPEISAPSADEPPSDTGSAPAADAVETSGPGDKDADRSMYPAPADNGEDLARARTEPVDPDAHPLPEPAAASALEHAETGTSDWDQQSGSTEPAVPPQPEQILAEPQSPAPASGELLQDPHGGSASATQEDFHDYASAGEPAEPRRRGLIGLLLALLLIAAAIALFWFLAPAEWKQRLGIAESNVSPVMVQLDQTNRRTLASGNELLEVTGKVINPTDQPQRVPQIEAMLRTYDQKVVYRWTIPPPAPVLAPGGSATFNSAELLSIPADAACLSVLARDPGGTQLEPCTPASQQVAAKPS